MMRGILAPIGRQTFKTADPVLAQAYEPIVAPPGKRSPEARGFEERSLLDQGIYDIVSGWARDEIASGDPARLERGLGYLSRAERLAGLSPAQREDLSALRAESGYFEAQRLSSAPWESCATRPRSCATPAAPAPPTRTTPARSCTTWSPRSTPPRSRSGTRAARGGRALPPSRAASRRRSPPSPRRPRLRARDRRAEAAAAGARVRRAAVSGRGALPRDAGRGQ